MFACTSRPSYQDEDCLICSRSAICAAVVFLPRRARQEEDADKLDCSADVFHHPRDTAVQSSGESYELAAIPSGCYNASGKATEIGGTRTR